MKEIQLTQDRVALVDDADFESVNKFKWHAQKQRRRFYAARTVRRRDGHRTTHYLHQFLMPGVASIDHEDGNGLNCQRLNLRPASKQQNAQAFCRKSEGKTSKFRGVSWDKKSQKWQAYIKLDGKKSPLGYFLAEREAAMAYDEAAKNLFGEFASPNIKELEKFWANRPQS